MDKIDILKARETDAEIILKLQKESYLSEALICNNYKLPPLVETVSDIINDFNEYLILKAVINRKIIGSVRAKINEGNKCYIGRLMVRPAFQNRGIGKKLMNYIEESFCKCDKFELFTGRKSLKNIEFYKNLGYRISGSGKLADEIDLVYMEKLNKKENSI